jgi:Protein of unknown function, DUF547
MKRFPKAPSGFLPARIIVLTVAILLLTWAGKARAAEFDQTYAGFDALLKADVTNGRVDYQSLKADPGPLNRYLDSAAGVSENRFNGWSVPRRLAFLINLYNGSTLKLIVDHYPLKSIKDIGSFFHGPWDQKVVRLFGKTITLNDLEHGILRKQYSEPRIHMALVCAAKGCPMLRSEAYRADRLDEQLNDQSRGYISSPAGLKIDRQKGHVYFSSIFKWYGKDFVTQYAPAAAFPGLDETESAVANFCQGYLDESDSDFLKKGGYSVKFLDYDWTLNEKQAER